MINFIVLTLVLLTQLAMNIYNYVEINNKDSTGTKDADTSKKLSLGALVLSGTFVLIILALHFTKMINYNRSEFLLLVSCIMIAIVMFLEYFYLDKQKKSNSGYKAKRQELKDLQVRVNRAPLDVALFGGIITVSVASIILFIIVGKYFYSEYKLVIQREPAFYDNSQVTVPVDTMNQPLTQEPDFTAKRINQFII